MRMQVIDDLALKAQFDDRTTSPPRPVAADSIRDREQRF